MGSWGTSMASRSVVMVKPWDDGTRGKKGVGRRAGVGGGQAGRCDCMGGGFNMWRWQYAWVEGLAQGGGSQDRGQAHRIRL